MDCLSRSFGVQLDLNDNSAQMLAPTRFRIRHYKSIVDATCYLASDLTILAGKNESGKSAVLEALRDFDRDATISDAARPHSNDESPSIGIRFRLDKEDASKLLTEIGLSTGSLAFALQQHLLQEGVALTKGSNGYKLDADTASVADRNYDRTGEVTLTRLNTIATALPDKYRQQIPAAGSQPKAIKATLAQWIAELNTQIIAEPDVTGFREILALVEEAQAMIMAEPFSTKLRDAVVARIPRFIFFSDFVNLLPDDVPISSAATNPAVSDFARVAELDLARLAQTTNPQRRANMLGQRSASLTGHFNKFWKQENVNLIAQADGETLRFWVQEQGSETRQTTAQRSQGFRWFLSFFLRLRAEQASRSVILIDEPGLYLHAKAQRDVLDVLESIQQTQHHTIVFSTHSPYLLDADRLDRVRLVVRKSTAPDGTKIQKVHAGADDETLTPIITAIGLDVTKQFSVASTKNVITEGISDYYYLQGIRQVIGDQLQGANVIGCVGATKVPQMVSLMIGWGLDYVVVLDNDQEGHKVARELKESLLVPEHKLSFSSDDRSIEDLFSTDDFEKFVLAPSDVEAPPAERNSARVKGLDKPLLAKTFCEIAYRQKVNLELSNQTKEAFKGLIERINSGFNAPTVDPTGVAAAV